MGEHGKHCPWTEKRIREIHEHVSLVDIWSSPEVRVPGGVHTLWVTAPGLVHLLEVRAGAAVEVRLLQR